MSTNVMEFQQSRIKLPIYFLHSDFGDKSRPPSLKTMHCCHQQPLWGFRKRLAHYMWVLEAGFLPEGGWGDKPPSNDSRGISPLNLSFLGHFLSGFEN
jgi:hypothetical protein